MLKQSHWVALPFALLGVALTWLLLGRPTTGIDDADIFFVYANHLAEGHGFVYNLGGERVEGFTSLAWTLVVAVFSRFLAHYELPLLILNVLLGTGVVWACLKRARHSSIFLIMLAAAPAWFAWTQITLMESGLWCLLITLLGLAVAERRNAAVCALLPLLLITRPESMLWGAWVVFIAFVAADKGRRIKAAVGPALSYALTLAALIAFRLSYFGYPFPNTYYAKVSPSLISNVLDGLGYAGGYAISGGMVILLLIALLAILVRERGSRNTDFLIAVFLLPGIGIPMLVGGDHFGGFRFYQPLWPLLCLLASNDWDRLRGCAKPRMAQAILVGLLLMGWALFPLTSNMKHEFRIAREGRAQGATLVNLFEKAEAYPSVAVITAGGNKLTYPGPVYDLMGLNNTEMAHAPSDAANFKNHTGFNRAVFYRWNPDIVLRGDSETFDTLVLNGLHSEPEFLERYERRTVRRGDDELTAWFSKELLKRTHSLTIIE